MRPHTGRISTAAASATAPRYFLGGTALVLLLGATCVAVLDGLDAIVFFGIRGVSATQIFQSIASGLLGSSAYEGGLATALLGAALHLLIALMIVATYYLASGYLTTLIRHPLAWGALYGCMVYAVMNLLVIPLSAARTGALTLPVVVNGLAIHVIGVGLVSALTARAARRR